MKEIKTISIKCDTKDTLNIAEMTELQGTLKHREDVDYDKIKLSMIKFGFSFPFFVAKLEGKNYILDGHGRFGTLCKMQKDGYLIPDLPVVYVECKDKTEAKEKLLRLNSQYGHMTKESVLEFVGGDFELNEEEIALPDTVIDFSDEVADTESEEDRSGNLVKNYVVPPFSVLDTRQKYWQDRKKQWLEKTGNLSETRDGDFGKVSGGKETIFSSINGGTSNFDPVLAEIMYKWFCRRGGAILDPFGGEQTKGVVAGELDYNYQAVEFRQDQVNLNNEKTKQYKNVHYVCGDSNNIDKLVEKTDFDFCFTSPPYYDLEVYSKDDMSALGSYEEFMASYENIFRKCYAKMKNDTFLVVKICEIRDKKTGIYRGFIPDNIKCFEKIGWHFYNEIILINAIGTGALRANVNMKTRKVVKIHQNVLVFYKGDVKNIAKKYPADEFFNAELLNEGNEDEIS